MEFDKLGRHCEHDNCNQKDFLPFTCDKCRKSLCFLHRSEFAHECVNKDMNDMTSMDCPVCKKSFKLTKTEDPNEAWERHFSTTCTQVPGSDKQPPQQCASPTCKVVLGPSNRFVCPLCRVVVCLGCRTLDAHQCAAAAPTKGLTGGANMVTAARLNKLTSNSSTANSNNYSSNHVKSGTATGRGKSNINKTATRNTSGGKSKGNRSSSSGSSSDNTLKGSAQRRMEQQRQASASGTHHHQPVGVASPPSSNSNSNIIDLSSATSESFDCPLCFQKYPTSTELVKHVDIAHNTPQPSSSPSAFSSSGNTPNSTTGRTPVSVSDSDTSQSQRGGPEVCPTCSQRFSDVMALIQHAERAHAGLGEGSTSSGGGGSDNKCRLS